MLVWVFRKEVHDRIGKTNGRKYVWKEHQPVQSAWKVRKYKYSKKGGTSCKMSVDQTEVMCTTKDSGNTRMLKKKQYMY